MSQLLFTQQATKALRKMPSNWSKRIRKKLIQVAAEPYGQHNNVTKLQGRNGYRLRVGDWRIIYEIKDGELVVLVLKIASRGDIYQ